MASSSCACKQGGLNELGGSLGRICLEWQGAKGGGGQASVSPRAAEDFETVLLIPMSDIAIYLMLL